MYTIGRFRYVHETSQVIGPSDYMEERGSRYIDSLINGVDPEWNVTAHRIVCPHTGNPDVYWSILLFAWKDYIAWQIARKSRGSSPSPNSARKGNDS